MAEVGSCDAQFTKGNPQDGGDIEVGSNNGHFIDGKGDGSPIADPLNKMLYGRDTDSQYTEVDDWASSLVRMLEHVPSYMCNPGHPGRISRIPNNLREVDVNAYEPYFVSIGPYHHGKQSVQPMENRKRFVLKYILENRTEVSLKDYLEELRTLEPAARSFYSDVEMDSEAFLHMLLLDSMFILPLFCGLPRKQDTLNHTNTVDTGITNEWFNHITENLSALHDNENKQMMAESDEDTKSGENNMPKWFWTLFQHDLFLLENQLPFFILQKLYVLAYGDSATHLVDILKVQVGNMLWRFTTRDPETVISPTEEVHHLLHLCHWFFRPTIPNPQEFTSCQLTESNQNFRLGSAIQLYESGVNFEEKSSSNKLSLLDITFCSSGTMSMPCLSVDDYTGSLLRNLIALEQMKYPCIGLDVSAYAVLMLHLITTPEDAELLRRKGIIQHHLASDKAMMYLVNRLSIGLAFDYVEDSYSLKPVFQALRKYTCHRVPKWRAWLKHRYFRNPWTVIPLCAGSLLLFLSILETFYTVYSYYYPLFDGRS